MIARAYRLPAATSAIRFCLFVFLVALGSAPRLLADTMTFDSTTPTDQRTIDVSNTAYEHMDIIVRGVTVTINGAHTFNSLLVDNKGVVTHAAGLDAGQQPTAMIGLDVAQMNHISADGKGYRSECKTEGGRREYDLGR